MSTSLLVSTGAVSCYTALMVNLGWFLDLLVNLSVSNPSVNCNSLVKFLCVYGVRREWATMLSGCL